MSRDLEPGRRDGERAGWRAPQPAVDERRAIREVFDVGDVELAMSVPAQDGVAAGERKPEGGWLAATSEQGEEKERRSGESHQRYSRPANTDAPSPGRNWAESLPRASAMTPVVAA